MIYFDHNATTPLLPAARQAWLDAAARFIGNPSSPHRLGARADATLHAAREQLAGFLGCDALDLVWTSGATESSSTVFHHLARGAAADATVWVSAIEHPCVLAAARHHFPNRVRLIPVTRGGVVELDWLRMALKKSRPALVAVMAANNETGVLQPWREVLELCRAAGVPFFCDAVQWIGKLPAHGLGGCDFVSGCAHKFGGPRGTGFLKCPARGQFHPLLLGGPQEEGRRAGTENVPGVLSMLAALAAHVAQSSPAASSRGVLAPWTRPGRRPRPKLARGDARATEKLAKPRATFERKLPAILPGVEILGAGEARLWNTVSVLMPEADCRRRWVVKLDKLGFAVSTGSACASGQEEPSHVLAAMGHTPAEAARVLRFSSGWATTAADWSALAQALRQVHAG
ncbi:MAG: cysteine desulfurase [Pedosphaera sp.]|nr:cysteine desulfurase [Pedosphaera sp.]